MVLDRGQISITGLLMPRSICRNRRLPKRFLADVAKDIWRRRRYIPWRYLEAKDVVFVLEQDEITTSAGHT